MVDKLEQSQRRFIDYLAVERGLSANTLAAYERDLTRYHQYLSAQKVTNPEQITIQLIDEFVTAAASGADGGKALTASSVARFLATIRGFHRYCLRENICTHNPAEGIINPKQKQNLPKALTHDQVNKLLEVWSGHDPAALRNQALLEMLYATGARISELMRLAIDDIAVNDELCLVKLRGKGNKERVVPVGTYARKALDRYLVQARPQLVNRSKKGSSALFLNLRGSGLSRQSAWTIITETSELAGLEVEISPHTLRHTFATHLLEGGADVRVVQELLGHANVVTTQIYTKVTAQTLREVYALSHPRAR